MVMLQFCRDRCLACVFSCALAAACAARAEVVELHADLTGACAGSGSSATGDASFALETSTGLLEWVIVHDDFDSGEFAAHIHGPNFSVICGLQPNSDVLILLPPGSPKIGSISLSAQQQEEFLAEHYYVNIHSVDAMEGEIKGVIKSGPPLVPTVSLWGLVALALVILTGATLGIRRQVQSLSA